MRSSRISKKAFDTPSHELLKNNSAVEMEERQLNGLMLFCATDNKELWLIVLNQTRLLLYLVSPRAPFLVHCCSLCM